MSMIVGTIWAVGVTAINIGVVAVAFSQAKKMARAAADVRDSSAGVQRALLQSRSQGLIAAVERLSLEPGEVLVIQPYGQLTEASREGLARKLADLGFPSGAVLLLENARLSVVTPPPRLEVFSAKPHVDGWAP